MTQSLFASSSRRALSRKIFTGLLMISLNLSMGGSGAIFTTNVAHAAVSTTIITDSFGIINTNTVTGWTEMEGNGQDARLETSSDRPGSPTKGHLRLRNDASVTRTVSTEGYSNIVLSYYWRGDAQAELADHLKIYWRALPSGEFQEVGDHALTEATSSWSSLVSVFLPTSASNTSIELKILGSTNSPSEEARIDDVTLSGTAIPQTLSVSTTGDGAGSVTSTPSGIACGSTCTTSFTNGTSATLTATPATGSTFSSWTGCDSTTENTCTVLMNSPRSVTSNFTLNTYTLTTNIASGSGKIEGTGISCGMGGSDCSEAYPYNTGVTLTETPELGYEFTGWGGACSGTATTCVVVMSDVTDVSASFRQIVVPPPPAESCATTISTDTIVSDTTNTTATDTPAIPTFDHAEWTADNNISGATWIWDGYHVTNPSVASTVAFTKKFSITGTPTSGSIVIATDNTYSATLNGSPVGTSAELDNFHAGQEDTFDVSSLLVSGQNTLVITVTNAAASTTNPEANPAGLLYKLTINKNACVPTPAPVCNPNVNLLENSGFEAPTVSGWDIIPFTNSALKWMGEFVTPGGLGRLGLELQASVAGAPFSGTQHAELDGDHPTRIYQDVVTIPGNNYSLTYHFSPRPDTSISENILEVAVGGNVLGTHTGTTTGNTAWTSYTKTFLATSTMTRVAFADIGNDDAGSTGGVGSYLDDVSFSCIGVHVGEPIDLCPNIQGAQEAIPQGYVLVGGQCVPSVVDRCSNLEGTQETVPEGYTSDGGMCYENKPADVCSNIEGTQESVPEGYESNGEGACYPTEFIDVCSNIEGAQSVVPPGMTASEGICTTIILPPTGETGGSSDFDYPGCTDQLAINFNRLANKDDGSCQLPTPPVGPTGSTGELPAEGEVLGVATTTEELPASCGEYLHGYLKMGAKNNPEEVKLLQTFLNEFMDAKLPVTGYFGKLTKSWVKKFQKKYHAEIIKPWVDAGYEGSDTNEGTGNVYKTTKRQINLMKCTELNIPMPDLKTEI